MFKPYRKTTLDGALAFRRCPNNGVQLDRFTCPQMLPKSRVAFRDSNELFLSDRKLPTGLIWKSNLIAVRLEEMDDADYGQVILDRKPFKITLNANMTLPRVKMSFVHEVLHVLCHMYKIDLSHEQLHVLALVIDNEVMPGLAALNHL